jgi:hypothetical protein
VFGLPASNDCPTTVLCNQTLTTFHTEGKRDAKLGSPISANPDRDFYHTSRHLLDPFKHKRAPPNLD